jgi:hypothetical protein
MKILFDSEGPIDTSGMVIWECQYCDGQVKPGSDMVVRGALNMSLPKPHIPIGEPCLILAHKKCYDLIHN